MRRRISEEAICERQMASVNANECDIQPSAVLLLPEMRVSIQQLVVNIHIHATQSTLPIHQSSHPHPEPRICMHLQHQVVPVRTRRGRATSSAELLWPLKVNCEHTAALQEGAHLPRAVRVHFWTAAGSLKDFFEGDV